MFKNIKILLFLSLVLILIPFSSIHADYKTYVQLNIQETKTPNGGILFVLNNVAPLYGNYESFLTNYDVNKGNPPDYVLEIYGMPTSYTLLGKYSLRSSRFTYWDSDTGGGVNEVTTAVIQAIIPYDVLKPSYLPKMLNLKNNIKTNLTALPVTGLKTLFDAMPKCKNENQTGSYALKNICCPKLIPVNKTDGTFVCVKCGDGICSSQESYTSCYKDCAPKTVAVTESDTTTSEKTFAESMIRYIRGTEAFAASVLNSFFSNIFSLFSRK